LKETIIIADDHPLTLNGIASFVASLGYVVLNTYTNGVVALNNILALRPHYAILDISMPGYTGLEVLQKVRAENKTVKIILYTMYQDTALFQKAKALGVNGYILKDFAIEELAECLAQLRYNKQWFSPRLEDVLVVTPNSSDEERLRSLSAAEQKIISLVAQGKSSKQIAEQLFISEKTVENHRSNIIKKLGLAGGAGALVHWATQYVK
jgi:DNA-binding NarL/FixJ family response regulator